jgi:translation initiation factor IF-3
MSRAREAGLDLVEVDSNAQPPVCRILDYGKWKYEQAKKEREGRKHQKGTMIHEVRLRPRTGQHDIDLKVRIVDRLLAEGDKVKLSVMFRGRELSHPEIGHEVLNKALTRLGDRVIVEKPPGMEGRFLSVILTPSLKKPAAAAPKLEGAEAPAAEKPAATPAKAEGAEGPTTEKPAATPATAEPAPEAEAPQPAAMAGGKEEQSG